MVSWVRVFGLAISCFLLLLLFLWFFNFRYIPVEVQRIFHSPVADIKSIKVLPTRNLSLISHEIDITNSAAIIQIMSAIRFASAYSSNHPADRWTCKLEISNSTGKSYISISATVGQGTILYCPNGPLRSDTLADILENASSLSETSNQQVR
jgi:hypothetical protein